MPGMRRGKRARGPTDDDYGGPEWTYATDPVTGARVLRHHFCSYCGEYQTGPFVGSERRVNVQTDEQGRKYHRLYAIGKRREYYGDVPGDAEEAEAHGYPNNNFSGGSCPDCNRELLAELRRKRQAQPPPEPPAAPPEEGEPQA